MGITSNRIFNGYTVEYDLSEEVHLKRCTSFGGVVKKLNKSFIFKDNGRCMDCYYFYYGYNTVMKHKNEWTWNGKLVEDKNVLKFFNLKYEQYKLLNL